jgi:hypothetical protein
VVVYGQKGIGDFEEDGVKIHLLKNQKYTSRLVRTGNIFKII